MAPTRHFGAALDLAIEALDRVRRVDLHPVLLREGHIGQHVCLCLVHKSSDLWNIGSELVRDPGTLSLGGGFIILGEGSAHEG